MREHILIVRPGALGDTILSLPLICSIRNRYEDAKITFLGNHRYRDLLPSGVEPARFDSTEWLWLMNDPETPLPTHLPKFDAAYLILKRPDSLMRNLQRAGTGQLFNASPEPVSGRHMTAVLHEALGYSIPRPQPCLKHLAATHRENLLWIHPGSGGPSKCLPLKVMAELACALQRRTGFTMAITMGEEDAFLKEQPKWKDLIQTPDTILLERLPLLDLCRKVGSARLFVGNDSGMSHLAAGLGVPAAVYFTITDPYVWVPWVPREQLHVRDLRGIDLTRIDTKREAVAILNSVTLY